MTDRTASDIFALPGYRRTLRVEPGAGLVRALLEDDLHAMAVDLRHDGTRVTGVTAVMDRAPWTTCPGALSVLHDTFAGVRLDEVTARRDKQANCTHLHDLAVLAAAHAGDAGPSEYAVAVSDANAGERVLEIRRDGAALHRWVEREGVLVAPAAVAGQSLMTLRDWIATLVGPARDAARLLQWAGLVAHGRSLSEDEKHAALFRQPSCFTMQRGRVENAAALAPPRDFSAGSHRPLIGLRALFAENYEQ
jgi:hypothetical protein